MRNQVSRAVFATALAAVLLGGSAHAATTTFTDKSAFLGGLTTTIVDDYDNPAYHAGMTDAEMSAVLNQADYTTPKDKTKFFTSTYVALDFGCSAQYPANGCTNQESKIGFADTSLSTDGAVYAVGFTYFDEGSVAKVTFGDGSSQILSLLPPIPPTFPDTNITPRFFGIQSTLGISSIDFTGLQTLGYDDWTEQEFVRYEGTFYIADLTIGGTAPAAVPEPATWAMMITGFFGVAAVARRKGRVQTA